jgi:hypothetical protein
MKDFTHLHGKKVIWFPHGFEAGNCVVGKLCIDQDKCACYVCQNSIKGSTAPDVFGYRYSYYYKIIRCVNDKDVYQTCCIKNCSKKFSI